MESEPIWSIRLSLSSGVTFFLHYCLAPIPEGLHNFLNPDEADTEQLFNCIVNRILSYTDLKHKEKNMELEFVE